jgi:class 3 adenylate cyclase
MRAPAVQVTEPGRSPLTLLITEDLDIGRDCNGLILIDASISRRHLSISPGGATVLVADLGSLNGSTVDGRPILQPHRLSVGEVVRFGGCTLALVAASADTAPHSGTRSAAEAGTVTIVFFEIEGSTASAGGPDDPRWHEVLAIHNQIMRRMLARHRGSETHSLGGGFMMCFGIARVALAFVIDVQRALAAYGLANPLVGLGVRAGVHTGEAVIGDDGEGFGRHVVMAARVADQARAGEILVSSALREIVESCSDVVFGESRTFVLNGVAGEHLLHRVVW